MASLVVHMLLQSLRNLNLEATTIDSVRGESSGGVLSGSRLIYEF